MDWYTGIGIEDTGLVNKSSWDIMWIRAPSAELLGRLSYLLGPLLLTWISNYIHHNVWDEITYPFLNFNSATVEV